MDFANLEACSLLRKTPRETGTLPAAKYKYIFTRFQAPQVRRVAKVISEGGLCHAAKKSWVNECLMLRWFFRCASLVRHMRLLRKATLYFRELLHGVGGRHAEHATRRVGVHGGFALIAESIEKHRHPHTPRNPPMMLRNAPWLSTENTCNIIRKQSTTC